MNLLSFATGLVDVAEKAAKAVENAKLVFTYAANVMNAAETAWEADSTAGATKKQMVMDAAKAFAVEAKADWPQIETALSAWVDVTIAAYNAVAALLPSLPTVDATTVTTAVATGEAAAMVVVNAAGAAAGGATTSTAATTAANTSGL